MPDQPSTNADPTGRGWTIVDPVCRLRLFGTERVFGLEQASSWVLGATSECSIFLNDTSGRVSRRHAALQREGETWSIRDLGSTNGVLLDGESRPAGTLAPGVEVQLGGVTLIAESRRSIELHDLLRRILGWSSARLGDVDRAFGIVREMAHLRMVLVLRGQGSLVGVAKRIHGLVLGTDRAFVNVGASQSAGRSIDEAANGTLCLDADDLPKDVVAATRALRLPETKVRLIACAKTVEAAGAMATLLPKVGTIAIPALSERLEELPRLIEAYGRDAAESLGASSLGFRLQDPSWLVTSGLSTLEEIEDVTHRLVALRNWGVTAGAERLGITHGALSRWARRRKLPT